MFKESMLMFIYTESSLHAGSGSSLGVVDLPIQREKYTDYPVLQASGIKGALREWFELNRGSDKDKIEIMFGPEFTGGVSYAGAASFTDGRLLLFPIRSLKGVFAYTTSFFALSRLKRDLVAANINVGWKLPTDKPDGEGLLGIEGSNLVDNKKVVLEEYAFNFKQSNEVKIIAEWLSNHAFPIGEEYNFWREKVKKDLVVLPDDVFKDFVMLSTEIQARIKIDNNTKTVVPGALFFEEALTPDTLLYSIVMANDPFRVNRPPDMQNAKDVIDKIADIDGKRTQFGGDTTIGKGMVTMRFLKGGVR